MPNPLFEELGGNRQQPQDMRGMVQAFQQFKSMIKGNPQQMVQNLIKSGLMSNEQYSQLANMARQLSVFFQ